MLELVLSDENKISILDSSAEEKSESEKTELEGEAEADFVNEYACCFSDLTGLGVSVLHRNISNIANPFLEIHSPPPDFI